MPTSWPPTLVEIEVADRTTRRIQRHLAESGLPPGKTFASFDFKAAEGVKKGQVLALADGHEWLDTGSYERHSIAITANQVFSAWEQVFPDPAMTVASIDRIVHHATIIEFTGQSYRQRVAELRMTKTEATAEN